VDWPAELQDRLARFARERDWEKYHTPRNLAALIASEAGELLALFRWDQDALSERRDDVEAELADVLLGVLRFADVAGIDLRSAALRKLEANARKYPARAQLGPDPVRAGTPGEPVVCGVDAGTLTSMSYVAWLRGNEFVLGEYRLDPAAPFPTPPAGWPRPEVVAFDLPQGLPAEGARRRRADIEAKTPTRALPTSRAELATWTAYRGFIQAGLETYWSIHENGLGDIAGLGHRNGSRPFVVETYPRYVIQRLWPELAIPSKRKDPTAYVAVLTRLLREKGYAWRDDVALRVDHVDAMMCAIAAAACLGGDGLPAGTVGVGPEVDSGERVLREGFIVSP